MADISSMTTLQVDRTEEMHGMEEMSSGTKELHVDEREVMDISQQKSNKVGFLLTGHQDGSLWIWPADDNFLPLQVKDYQPKLTEAVSKNTTNDNDNKTPIHQIKHLRLLSTTGSTTSLSSNSSVSTVNSCPSGCISGLLYWAKSNTLWCIQEDQLILYIIHGASQSTRNKVNTASQSKESSASIHATACKGMILMEAVAQWSLPISGSLSSPSLTASSTATASSSKSSSSSSQAKASGNSSSSMTASLSLLSRDFYWGSSTGVFLLTGSSQHLLLHDMLNRVFRELDATRLTSFKSWLKLRQLSSNGINHGTESSSKDSSIPRVTNESVYEWNSLDVLIGSWNVAGCRAVRSVGSPTATPSEAASARALVRSMEAFLERGFSSSNSHRGTTRQSTQNLSHVGSTQYASQTTQYSSQSAQHASHSGNATVASGPAIIALGLQEAVDLSSKSENAKAFFLGDNHWDAELLCSEWSSLVLSCCRAVAARHQKSTTNEGNRKETNGEKNISNLFSKPAVHTTSTIHPTSTSIMQTTFNSNSTPLITASTSISHTASNSLLVAPLQYDLLESRAMFGLVLVLLVRSDLKRQIKPESLQVSCVKTGLGGLHSNKGGLLLRFILKDSSFCFASVHLAAGQTEVSARNRDASCIIMEPQFLPYEPEAIEHNAVERTVHTQHIAQQLISRCKCNGCLREESCP